MKSERKFSVGKLSKVSERKNHLSTRNADFQGFRIIKSHSSKAVKADYLVVDSKFANRLQQDRRKLSRFINEPSTLQIASDAKYILKGLNEVVD